MEGCCNPEIFDNQQTIINVQCSMIVFNMQFAFGIH